MRIRSLVAMLIGCVLTATQQPSHAQVTEIGGVGNIFEKRKSAKSTPAPNKPSVSPQTNAKSTPPPNANRQAAPQATPPGAPSPGRPPGAASTAVLQRPHQANTPPGKTSAAPAGSGQLRIVTKALADSVRTVKVDYDPEELASSGTAIILNPRRYRSSETNSESEKRTNSPFSETAPFAKPL